MKYLFIVFNFLAINAFCQKKSCITIQYIALSDTIISREISRTIIKESNSNDPEHLFQRGFGYITLHVKSFINSDTIYSYYISPSLYNIRQKDSDNKYPAFYTYIDKRIVLIYFDALQSSVVDYRISLKSKAKLRKKVSLFLEKPVNQTFYDSSGHKVFRDKNFILDRFRFDAGKYIFVLKNSAHIIHNENNNKQY